MALPDWATPHAPTCAAVAALLHPHAEVALHDLATDTIVGLWNASPGRRVGDPSLLAELPLSWADHPVQGPYRKVDGRGREIGAVSAMVHDGGGAPRGLLCINLDRTPLLDLAAVLTRVGAPVQEPPPELFERDWREQIALAVDAGCRERGVDRGRLTRADRMALVERLEELGLFATRHAVDHAAAALRVSRATVYAMVKEVRGARDVARVQA